MRWTRYLIELADFFLTLHILLKVCKHFETEGGTAADTKAAIRWFAPELRGTSARVSPVMFEEHLSQVFEKFWVSGAEEPAGDLVHHLFELWDLVVVKHGVISAP